MVLEFKIDLKKVGSLATENGLQVVGFYTDLVELKQKRRVKIVLDEKGFILT